MGVMWRLTDRLQLEKKFIILIVFNQPIMWQKIRQWFSHFHLMSWGEPVLTVAPSCVNTRDCCMKITGDYPFPKYSKRQQTCSRLKIFPISYSDVWILTKALDLHLQWYYSVAATWLAFCSLLHMISHCLQLQHAWINLTMLCYKWIKLN